VSGGSGQGGGRLRFLGRVDYQATSDAMQRFTASRGPDTADEIWLCEHPPVYTQGVAGQAAHLLFNPTHIPVVQSNRGGQITYHGPGQVVAYPLIDLQRLGIYVKEYVYRLEHCVLATLEGLGLTGHRVPGAPGIYVRLADPFSHAPLESAPPRERLGVAAPNAFAGLGKIAALGVKVSRHRTYHGLALNVAMDLRPYAGINPCGYAGLATVDLATLGINASWDAVAHRLAGLLASHLSP
jgi:lipoyl(octanoyl) transferase